MPKEPKKTIDHIVAELGRYPIEAFQFLRDGLSYTVDSVHGEQSDIERQIHQMMVEQGFDYDDLEELLEEDALPDEMADFLHRIGGAQGVNRHVRGEQLCWGLRDYALARWGFLASTVLRSWNIRATEDFGRIVFALVDNGYLQKEPHDTLTDFQRVYDFDEAFDQSYRIPLREELD